MNKTKYIARHKKSSRYVYACEIDYILTQIKGTIDDYDFYIDSGTGERKINNPREYLKQPKSLESLIYDMCVEKDDLETRINKTIQDIETFKNDIKKYQEQDKINHQNISLSLVGIRLNTFLKDLKGSNE